MEVTFEQLIHFKLCISEALKLKILRGSMPPDPLGPTAFGGRLSEPPFVKSWIRPRLQLLHVLQLLHLLQPLPLLQLLQLLHVLQLLHRDVLDRTTATSATTASLDFGTIYGCPHTFNLIWYSILVQHVYPYISVQYIGPYMIYLPCCYF